MEKAEVPERSLRQIRELDGFLSSDLKKNDRANIAGNELEALQDLAQELLARSSNQLNEAVQDGTLLEICNGH